MPELIFRILIGIFAVVLWAVWRVVSGRIIILVFAVVIAVFWAGILGSWILWAIILGVRVLCSGILCAGILRIRILGVWILGAGILVIGILGIVILWLIFWSCVFCHFHYLLKRNNFFIAVFIIPGMQAFIPSKKPEKNGKIVIAIFSNLYYNS